MRRHVLQVSFGVQGSGGYESKCMESLITDRASVNVGLPAEYWNEGLGLSKVYISARLFRGAIPVSQQTSMQSHVSRSTTSHQTLHTFPFIPP